ncbi:hypothetical protein F7734_25525 [Scytonema sp. UIC 10036]|uniref:hypothetical protein n=1 Tax=Scytonema sp. UIC 10036 TaxID=2304196 RepID=UPI0012DA5BB4|nr:hypothetical protein [Scytonema sp. UIC 10036]MUG95539.1 hypothetical protein [Scytonema sp. UIC 10036]
MAQAVPRTLALTSPPSLRSTQQPPQHRPLQSTQRAAPNRTTTPADRTIGLIARAVIISAVGQYAASSQPAVTSHSCSPLAREYTVSSHFQPLAEEQATSQTQLSSSRQWQYKRSPEFLQTHPTAYSSSPPSWRTILVGLACSALEISGISTPAAFLPSSLSSLVSSDPPPLSSFGLCVFLSFKSAL